MQADTKAILDYNKGRDPQRLKMKLAGMMGMLTATVTSISTASHTAVEQLSKVERRIEQISYSTDLLNLNTAVQNRGQQMRHVLKTWDLGRGSGV